MKHKAFTEKEMTKTEGCGNTSEVDQILESAVVLGRHRLGERPEAERFDGSIRPRTLILDVGCVHKLWAPA
jgi:hypothetical protein